MRAKMDKINVIEIETISPSTITGVDELGNPVGITWEKRLARCHEQLSKAETEWAKEYLANVLFRCLRLASKESNPKTCEYRSYNKEKHYGATM
jgi:hypothetical protein|tara:strand:+ start:838 stop:1119 length:282 start_codon:yes stop_codon:yes gene_type:complete